MKNLSFVLALLGFILIIACGGKEGDYDLTQNKYASLNEGSLTVYCENSSYDLMKRPFKMYDSAKPKTDLNIVETPTLEVMAKLLAGECQVAIMSRAYTEKEDSLMKEYKVQTHKKMLICEDALVFYTKKDFPLDTINEEQLKQIFSENKNISDFYPELKSEPKFAMNDQYSSEYENLKAFLTNRVMPKKRIKMFKNPDSVISFVKNNYAIGIGYFSQIVNDDELKALKVGFTYYKGMYSGADGRYTDSTGKYIKDSENKVDNGKYIKPHLVHQANIVQRLTPFIIRHEAYLFENRQDLSWWFATFLEKEFIVQQYFLNSGIVPGYARFKLIQED
jgi:ABC-type phosphate transport system substrate-binding protein